MSASLEYTGPFHFSKWFKVYISILYFQYKGSFQWTDKTYRPYQGNPRARPPICTTLQQGTIYPRPWCYKCLTPSVLFVWYNFLNDLEVKMSEEAGIQFFGPDNDAIRKVRLIVISTSGIISLALILDSGNFERTFYPDTIIYDVMIIFLHRSSDMFSIIEGEEWNCHNSDTIILDWIVLNMQQKFCVRSIFVHIFDNSTIKFRKNQLFILNQNIDNIN